MGKLKATNEDLDKWQALIDSKTETYTSVARDKGMNYDYLCKRMKKRREELKNKGPTKEEIEKALEKPYSYKIIPSTPKPSNQYIRIPIEHKPYIKRALITALSAYKRYKDSESARDYLDTWEEIKSKYF